MIRLILSILAIPVLSLSLRAASIPPAPPGRAFPPSLPDSTPLPPDPAAGLVEEAAPALTPRQLKIADIAARTAAREAERAAMPVATQRMARAKSETVARIETDAKTGRKTAVIIRADDTIERRPVRVLATARVLPKAPPQAEPLLDGTHAATAAAAFAAGAAAAAAAAAKKKKASAPSGAGPG